MNPVSQTNDAIYISLMGQLDAINRLPEENDTQRMQKSAAYTELAGRFRSIGEYSDAMTRSEQCSQAATALTVYIQQRQTATSSVKKPKKKKRKRWLVAILALLLIAAGGYAGMLKYTEYREALPDQFQRACNEALDAGDFEEAAKQYRQYLTHYYSGERLTSKLEYAKGYSYMTYTNKDELIAYYEADFAETCREMQLSAEALELIINGDYQAGQTYLVDNGLDQYGISLRNISLAHAQELLPRLISTYQPVEIQTAKNALYWLNPDGTVGTIGGDIQFTETLADITDFKIGQPSRTSENYHSIAALSHDGILYTNVLEPIHDVASFDIDYGVLAYITAEGNMKYEQFETNYTYHTDYDYMVMKQSGLDGRDKGWADLKAVKVVVNTPILHNTEKTDRSPVRTSKTLSNAVCIAALGNDGRIYFSGYSVNITYPRDDERARAIAGSISGGWNDVADYLTGKSSSPGSSSNNVQPGRAEVIPTPEYTPDFNEPSVVQYKLSLNSKTGYFREICFTQDSGGPWTASLEE